MGNIGWISRNGSTNNGATIVSQDRLEYAYNGNQVTAIRDWSNNALGFNDKAKGNPSTYYTYDASGRLFKDNNLKNTYTYNHLNLVKQVEQTGVTNKLAYTYDATGRRLKKQFGTDVNKARYYTDGIELAGDTTMIQTTFGRLRRIGNSSPWDYDYFLKDHLGNVRVVLTAGAVTTSVYMATMEEGASPNPSQGGETAAYESFYFANLDQTRADKPYNYPDNNPLNQKVAKVAGKSQGPAITLRVMAGDTITISAKAFYNMDNTLPGKDIDIAPVVGSAIAAMTNPTGTALSEAAQLALDLGAEASQSVALVTLPEENNDEKLVQPKSGINFVLYNSEFEIVEANTGVQVVSDKINTIQTLATDKMVMTEAGFLEIFINNEAQTPVYYDNLMITQTNSQVKEIDAYYPFGAMIPQLSVIAAREEYNGYKYNAKELQKELGMNQLDYGKRMYDPAVARFMVPDRLAEKFPWQSPYCYAANNPVSNVDFMGDSATFAGDASQTAISFLNIKLAGFYTFSTDENGLVSMTAVQQQENQNLRHSNQMTSEQREFANQLDAIINGNGMTTVNMVNNDNSTLIGDITTGTIDMGDIAQIGTGQYVNETGAFIHEFNEQFQVQVNSKSDWQAHRSAVLVEGRVTGNVYDPMRQITVTTTVTNPKTGAVVTGGTITTPVRNPSTTQWHNVMIDYYNGNVTGIRQ